MTNMRITSRPRAWALIALGTGFLLLLVTAGRLLLPGLRLEVLDTRTGALLHSVAVRNGDTFLLRYTHSTAKTAVEEHFRIEGADRMVLTTMVYASAGAGIPDLPPGGGKFRLREDNRFAMEEMSLRFAALHNIRVAWFYPFVLEAGGRAVDLTEAARGRLVDILIRPR
jgi:hypothetical protein